MYPNFGVQIILQVARSKVRREGFPVIQLSSNPIAYLCPKLNVNFLVVFSMTGTESKNGLLFVVLFVARPHFSKTYQSSMTMHYHQRQAIYMSHCWVRVSSQVRV